MRCLSGSSLRLPDCRAPSSHVALWKRLGIRPGGGGQRILRVILGWMASPLFSAVACASGTPSYMIHLSLLVERLSLSHRRRAKAGLALCWSFRHICAEYGCHRHRLMSPTIFRLTLFIYISSGCRLRFVSILAVDLFRKIDSRRAQSMILRHKAQFLRGRCTEVDKTDWKAFQQD